MRKVAMTGSVKFSIQSLIARYPRPLLLWAKSRRRLKPLIVTPTTQLVIEGFPRCANSFAVVAFESAQPKPVLIAHHLHAEAQVTLAVKYRIPVLVLYREPVGAVTSLIARHPEISTTQALGRYVRFYKTITEFAEQVVLADFAEVISEFDKVIDRLNRRFGSEFTPYVNSEQADRRVFDVLDALNVADSGGLEDKLARPSSRKAATQMNLREKVISHHLLPEARAMYARINELALRNKADFLAETTRPEA